MTKKAAKPKAIALPLRIKQMREARGWTQEHLAVLLDTSDATINRLEKGKQNWTPPLLQAASRVFGCSIYELLPPEPGSFAEVYQRLDAAAQESALAMLAGLAQGAKARKVS